MRKIISIALLITYLILSITGIQLTFPHDKGTKPSAVISEERGSTTRIVEKTKPPFYPKGMHEWAGYIFILSGLVHIYLNRKPIKSYLHKRVINNKHNEHF